MGQLCNTDAHCCEKENLWAPGEVTVEGKTNQVLKVNSQDTTSSTEDMSNVDKGSHAEAQGREPGGGTSASALLAAKLRQPYGRPAPARELQEALPAGGGGLVWEATLADETWAEASHCLADGTIRPRRRALPVRAGDFFSSLVGLEDGRWIFSGELNGWPGLNCLELRRVAARGSAEGGSTTSPASSSAHWDAAKSSNAVPSFPSGCKSAQVTLRMAPWSAKGWSKEAPGWVWWFFAQRSPGPTLAFGQDMLRTLRADLEATGQSAAQAVAAHLFVHRYAVGTGQETRADLATYHAAVLLEWDHGRHASVAELGPLNGVSARRGRSDWYHDKLEETTALLRATPGCMVMPWVDDLAEIRVSDVEARNLDEFKAYVARYEGHALRFVKPCFTHSGPVHLPNKSQVDVMRYLLNYMSHERKFEIRTRNCQSFACDFYSLLTGDIDVEPYNPMLAAAYVNRTNWFLNGSRRTALTPRILAGLMRRR